ncbi:hypothetical protein M9435_003050 [Picochlorum sp. BPE23]|nr:hypothetical protein M9435_003050 [Picochlorum sp. BPE23]
MKREKYIVDQLPVDPEKIMGPPEEAILPFPPEEAKERIAKMDAVVMFEKGLTQSDTSGTGRIVIPKAIAESHFPSLNDPSEGVVLRVIDVFGTTRGVKFRFWVNNSSRMYIVEGTRFLLQAFKLSVGDVIMFAKDTEGQIYVCGRKGTKDDMFRKPPSFTRKKKPKIADGSSKEGKDKGNGHRREKTKASTSPSREQDYSKDTMEKSAPARHKVRTLTHAETELDGSYVYWNGQSFPPRADGVFRAVSITRVRQPDQVSVQFGMWCATVTLAGEQYQAFFDSKDASVAALSTAEQSIL